MCAVGWFWQTLDQTILQNSNYPLNFRALSMVGSQSKYSFRLKKKKMITIWIVDGLMQLNFIWFPICDVLRENGSSFHSFSLLFLLTKSNALKGKNRFGSLSFSVCPVIMACIWVETEKFVCSLKTSCTWSAFATYFYIVETKNFSLETFHSMDFIRAVFLVVA